MIKKEIEKNYYTEWVNGKYKLSGVGSDENLNLGYKMITNAVDKFNLQKGEVVVFSINEPIFYIEEGKIVFNEQVINKKGIFANTSKESGITDPNKLSNILKVIMKDMDFVNPLSEEMLQLAVAQKRLIKQDVSQFFKLYGETILEIDLRQEPNKAYLLRNMSEDYNLKYEKAVLAWFNGMGVKEDSLEDLMNRIYNTFKVAFPNQDKISINVNYLCKLI